MQWMHCPVTLKLSKSLPVQEKIFGRGVHYTERILLYRVLSKRVDQTRSAKTYFQIQKGTFNGKIFVNLNTE